MKDIYIVDISDCACNWIDFLKTDVLGSMEELDHLTIESALMLYNKEYQDLEMFLENIEISGLHDGMSGFYLYDYIFENVDAILIEPIQKITGKDLIMQDVMVKIVNVTNNIFSAFAIFK